jgi:hypothetical protein
VISRVGSSAAPASSTRPLLHRMIPLTADLVAKVIEGSRKQ